jgi:predicted Zn-dependent protease
VNRRLLFLAALLSGGSLVSMTPPAWAAERPVFDPQKLLDRMFGEETEADQQALAAILVSAEEERRIGRAATEAFRASLRQRGLTVATGGGNFRYLEELVALIRPKMTNADRYPTIQIYVITTPQCNAWAMPGGTIFFCRGLLQRSPSEAAVVGLVGHELSHLDRGHLLGRVRRLKLAQQTFAAPDGVTPEQFFDAGSRLMETWTHPFHPKEEAQADADGARWAYEAGYDCRELGRLFLLAAPRGEAPLPPICDFLRSHPDAKSRNEAILKIYKQEQQADPKPRLYVGKENLRRRISKAEQEFPE